TPRSNGTNGEAGGGQMLLCLGDAELAEVEDGGGQHGVGLAFERSFGQVFEGARSPAGDHRQVARLADGAGELDVVAVLGAVPVHGGEQDLAGAEALALG